MEDLKYYCETFEKDIDPNRRDVFHNTALDSIDSLSKRIEMTDILVATFGSSLKSGEISESSTDENPSQMKMLGNICEIMLPTSLTMFIQLLIDTAII